MAPRTERASHGSELKAPYIIADIGSNWRQLPSPMECALEHIKAAGRCGVSAAKFQFFTHEELYGRPGDNTYSLPVTWLPALKDQCDEVGVDFMCTAFSEDGVWAVDPFVKMHKVASAEMMHTGILDAIKETGKPFIVSTGGATAEDVAWLIGTYKPNVLMECVASYPAKAQDYNLRFLHLTGSPAVGVSDHTLTDSMALAAVGMGATYFEKHFIIYPALKLYDENTVSGMRPWTPDYGHSINEAAMVQYVRVLKEGYSALGDGRKTPRDSEIEFCRKYRRPKGLNFRSG